MADDGQVGEGETEGVENGTEPQNGEETVQNDEQEEELQQTPGSE